MITHKDCILAIFFNAIKCTFDINLTFLVKYAKIEAIKGEMVMEKEIREKTGYPSIDKPWLEQMLLVAFSLLMCCSRA